MRFRLFATSLLLCSLSTLSYALEKPTGRTILSVSGAIETTNTNDSASFDLNMLNALPQHTVVTENPWAEGVHTYRGFSVASLLEKIGNKGNLLQVFAMNGYMTEIPINDFLEKGAIFATHQDGKNMSIRNLGPIMVIYPFDSQPELRNEIFYSRSIWQINKIKSIVTTE